MSGMGGLVRLAAVISMVVAATGVLAHSDEGKDAAGAKKHPKIYFAIGDVAAVDAKANRLVIKRRSGKTSEYLVQEGLRIRSGRTYITLSGVAVGDWVGARVESRKEGETITSIRHKPAVVMLDEKGKEKK